MDGFYEMFIAPVSALKFLPLSANYIVVNVIFVSLLLKKKQAKNESPLKEISSAHDESGEWFPVPAFTSALGFHPLSMLKLLY